MKEKRTKCDQWIKPWLERRNQQERSSESVLEIRFFRKLRKIHRKMSVLQSLFNEVSGLETCNFVKSDSSKDVFP